MEPYDPKKRYCGPGKGVIAWLVPEKPLGVCINECCYKHDEAYDHGGSGHDRLRADEVFRLSIRVKLAAHWWIPLFVASWIAQRYFKAVRILGSTCFNYRAVPDERLVALVKAAKELESDCTLRRVGDGWTEHGVYDKYVIALRTAICSAEEALAEAGDQNETDTA